MPELPVQSASNAAIGWTELWHKEDGGPVWLGLGLVAVLLFANGATIKYLAVEPPRWDTLATLCEHFRAQFVWYVLQFAL